MTTLAEAVISLFPRTWDQRYNRARRTVMEQQLDRLTGTDTQRYNDLVELIEQDQYLKFCTLVRRTAQEQGHPV